VISFVITARDEPPALLARTIDELRATTPSLEREIVVVDDGSTIPVGAIGPDIEVLRNIEPEGVSRARRRGCAAGTGRVLVCLDAHMTFDRAWLELMLAEVESGALLCSAFWDYEREACHCFGADFEWCGERDYTGQRYPGLQLAHRVSRPRAAACDVPMAIGACYMVLRSTYATLGGFSPLFRVWGADEQDLSARAWLAGHGVRCVTNARVGHFWRPTFPYPVYFEHLEFNQLTLIRSVFDDTTATMLEASFHPIPRQVGRWLDAVDGAAWRAVVQRARRVEDRDFFLRFLPALHRRRVRIDAQPKS
jgi:glycosyltransferase involved in cell wall biosynthesis